MTQSSWTLPKFTTGEFSLWPLRPASVELYSAWILASLEGYVYSFRIDRYYGTITDVFTIFLVQQVLTLPDFKKEFGLTQLSKKDASNLSANLVSVMQAGAVLGALVANPMADR
jgi:hypothetical protein